MEQLSLWGSPHEFVFLVTSRLVFIRRSPIGLCKVDSLSLLYISSLSFWLMNLATWFITVPYQFVNSYRHYIDTSINIMINNVIIIVLISSLLIPHDLLLLLIPYTVIRAKQHHSTQDNATMQQEKLSSQFCSSINAHLSACGHLCCGSVAYLVC